MTNVVRYTALRPNALVRAALTANAKNALTSAEYDIKTNRRYLGITWCVTAAAELAGMLLVDDLGADHKPTRRYAVNASGDVMREHLVRENALRALGRAAREHNITGEDLADVAAAVDAGQEECIGVAPVFYLTFKSRTEIDKCSGADLRQEVENVLGWRDDSL